MICKIMSYFLFFNLNKEVQELKIANDLLIRIWPITRRY
jgi:hypothetical protein